MNVPVGHGLPWWLPMDRYLSAYETRQIGEVTYGGGGWCCYCKKWEATERAHIVRRQMGGKVPGTYGPVVTLCKERHTFLDQHEHVTLAVRREDHSAVWVEHQDGEFFERELK